MGLCWPILGLGWPIFGDPQGQEPGGGGGGCTDKWSNKQDHMYMYRERERDIYIYIMCVWMTEFQAQFEGLFS